MIAIASTIGILLAVFLLGTAIEQLRPVEKEVNTRMFNTIYASCVAILSAGLEPLAGLEISYLMHGTHPIISLPVGGWRTAASVFTLLVSKDAIDYSYHRAQHKFPILWAMHSFHHSDHAVNITTSQRHFWLERVLFLLIFYVPLGVVFAFSRTVALLYILGAMFFSLFPHMNLRLEFGEWSWMMLGPQLHRLHHSSRAEDYDRNFAGIFPIFDVIFGTYKHPSRGEFPPTGVGEEVHPSPIQALLWPVSDRSGFARHAFGYERAPSLPMVSIEAARTTNLSTDECEVSTGVDTCC